MTHNTPANTWLNGIDTRHRLAKKSSCVAAARQMRVRDALVMDTNQISQLAACNAYLFVVFEYHSDGALEHTHCVGWAILLFDG